jgi:hypothetical protein
MVSNANGWNITDQPITNQFATVSERIGAGKLHVEAKAAQNVSYKFFPKMPALSDFDLTVQGQRLSGATNAPYGLIFRLDSNGNYYMFAISDTQQFGVWLYQGQWTTLINGTGSDAIQPGAVNHLAVIAQGSHCSFFINNQQVGALDNNQVSTGLAGVAIELSAGDQSVLEFSNFQLRAP